MTEDLKIKDLILLEKNPRKITKDQMQKLCDSLESDPAFLEKRPILVNKIEGTYQVYAGNQRIRAAKKLKWLTVPCLIDENLDEKTVKQRIIKDNQTFGEFDYDILANEWEIDLLLESGMTEGQLDILNFEDQEICLPGGEKGLSSMIFTISSDQKEIIDNALKIAKKQGPFIDTENENSNGNAISRVCEFFISRG